MFALRTIIFSVAEPRSLFPWRNSGGYSIWMQLTSHSSLAGVCKCLFYYNLKINALATVSKLLYFIYVSYSFEMQECRRKGIMDVGYMDPLMICQTTLKLHEKDTLDNVFMFLDKHHDKGAILLPYNFG